MRSDCHECRRDQHFRDQRSLRVKCHHRGRLTKYAEELAGLPGCIFYGITRSAKDSRQWVLTGHWESQNQMVQHFAAVDIHKIIEILEFPSVGIRFGSFFKADYAEANHEFR